MPIKSKNGDTKHDRRNAHIRERANAALRLIGGNVDDFLALLNKTAEKRKIRWYKKPSDIRKSVVPWLNGKTGMYYWALDVVELAVIEVEAQQRAKRAHPSEPVITVSEPMARLAAVAKPYLPEAELDTAAMPELDVEITAMQRITDVLEPLEWPARVRVLNYMRSRYADKARSDS